MIRGARTSRGRWQVLVAAAMLSLVGSACRPAPTPPPPESFAAAGTEPTVAETPAPASVAELERGLGALGLDIVPEGEQTLEYLDTPAQIYGIGEGTIEVHQYPTAASAAATAARISPDARIVTQPDGQRTAVEWLGSPHVFVRGPLLVIYVGTDRAVLDALTGLLGRQIAGD